VSDHWDEVIAAVARYAPAVTDRETTALLPLLIGHDPRLLNLIVDAYRLGYHVARGEQQEDDLLDAVCVLPEQPDEPVAVRVGTRMRGGEPGEPPRFQVMIDLDGHVFASSALFHADVTAERARVETAMALRRPLAVEDAVPFLHWRPKDVDA